MLSLFAACDKNNDNNRFEDPRFIQYAGQLVHRLDFKFVPAARPENSLYSRRLHVLDELNFIGGSAHAPDVDCADEPVDAVCQSRVSSNLFVERNPQTRLFDIFPIAFANCDVSLHFIGTVEKDITQFSSADKVGS